MLKFCSIVGQGELGSNSKRLSQNQLQTGGHGLAFPQIPSERFSSLAGH